MKWLWLVTVGSLVCSAGGNSTWAADTRDDVTHVEIRKMCGPVCELKSQDMAFSLLAETYRQFQSKQIEEDYQARLRQANAMSAERGSLVIESSTTGIQTLRKFVFLLAKEEHDLRMQKLQSQVTNFHTAYNCARKLDEESVGVTVASAVDQHVAAKKLQDFVIVTPGTLAQGNALRGERVPASTVLCNSPEVPPDPAQVIESCN